jgi:hypothetical protein
LPSGTSAAIARPTTSTSSGPSPTEAAAAPRVVCDQPPIWTTEDPVTKSQIPLVTTLTCGNAVAAALAVVPAYEAIAYVEFHFGSYCPPGAYCAATFPDRGYVVVHLKVRGPDLWVGVSVTDKGVMSTTAPEPFPPGSA